MGSLILVAQPPAASVSGVALLLTLLGSPGLLLFSFCFFSCPPCGLALLLVLRPFSLAALGGLNLLLFLMCLFPLCCFLCYDDVPLLLVLMGVLRCCCYSVYGLLL